jgi:hypothetical protein
VFRGPKDSPLNGLYAQTECEQQLTFTELTISTFSSDPTSLQVLTKPSNNLNNIAVKDDIYCAKCDRRIVYVKSDEEVEAQAVKSLIPELRETLIKKLKALTEIVDDETDTESLTKLANLMVLLLQALHKLETMNA